jgi:signal transduction histidine kinase
MLYAFLSKYRDTIVAKSTEFVAGQFSSDSLQKALKESMANYLEQLIITLRQNAGLESSGTPSIVNATQQGASIFHGGHEITEIVHQYGTFVESIMEIAKQQNEAITHDEIKIVSHVFDRSIAAGIREFVRLQEDTMKKEEIRHLGVLAHELRNSLMGATVAFEIIKEGVVGLDGETSELLNFSLKRIEYLVNNSLTEVRMHQNFALDYEPVRLVALFDELKVMMAKEYRKRNIAFSASCDDNMNFEADRQLLISAITNLLQNAFKYSKANGHVLLRGKCVNSHIEIEVEDECGGLSEENEKRYLRPFNQGEDKTTGIGLGLHIVEQVIEKHHGELIFRNNPGKGCVFGLRLPVSKK